MRNVLYPGSFDPLTNGHLDLIARASKLFDRVIVAVAINSEKHPMFSIDERVQMIEESCAEYDNVCAVPVCGLLVDALEKYQANAILRGLRAFSDFEYELQMALMNRSLRDDCETIFMMPTTNNSFVSSRLVKEVANLGADYTKYVPPAVALRIAEKLKERKQ
jgi:pantetheine-phosphate adenylyltransferase